MTNAVPAGTTPAQDSGQISGQQRASRYLRRKAGNATLLLLADTVSLLLALMITVGIVALLGQPPLPESWMLVFSLTCLGGSLLSKLYPGWGMGLIQEVRRLSYVVAFAALLSLSLAWSERHTVWELLLVFGTAALSWALFLLGRLAVRLVLLARNAWGVPVAVYGAGATGRLVIEALQDDLGYGYRPAVVYDDNPALHGQQVCGVPVMGDIYGAQSGLTVAVVAMPGLARERLLELLSGPLRKYRTVIMIPDLFNVQSLWVKGRDLNGVLGLEINHNLADPVSRFIKRSGDLALVLFMLPLWGGLCLLIALLIWLEDRRSPLFFQDRVGKSGVPFQTWKFRTMVPDAEAVLRHALEDSPELRAEWETDFKLRRDPRITRVGALLRRTSLDELPQLINVLRSEMSLVGPRPLPGYHQSNLPQAVQTLRGEVRPGLTGLWQVSGRSDTGSAGMERWDPYYVQNWSIWLDIVVLLRTIQVVVRGSGAY